MKNILQPIWRAEHAKQAVAAARRLHPYSEHLASITRHPVTRSADYECAFMHTHVHIITISSNLNPLMTELSNYSLLWKMMNCCSGCPSCKQVLLVLLQASMSMLNQWQQAHGTVHHWLGQKPYCLQSGHHYPNSDISPKIVSNKLV